MGVLVAILLCAAGLIISLVIDLIIELGVVVLPLTALLMIYIFIWNPPRFSF